MAYVKLCHNHKARPPNHGCVLTLALLLLCLTYSVVAQRESMRIGSLFTRAGCLMIYRCPITHVVLAH
jgi:hypothetical protein